MNGSGKRRSKRFVPSGWLQRLVPMLLGLLLLGLIFTILVVILVVLGVLPG